MANFTFDQMMKSMNGYESAKKAAGVGEYAKTQPTATQQPSQPKAPDYTDQINSQYDNLISALKSQIQQSINSKQQQISGLQQKYQPQRDQSEVQRGNDLRSVLEQSYNAGDRGGIGRQNALETQTAADNRLNQIDLQQQSEVAALQNDINNLVLEGNTQEAQYKAQQLKDLMTYNQWQQEYNQNAENNKFDQGVTLAGLMGTYNGQQTMQGAANAANIANTKAQTTAQEIQNKYLPQQIQASLAKSSSGGSGGGHSTSGGTYSATSIKKAKEAISGTIDSISDASDRVAWLNAKKPNIIATLGNNADAIDYYNSLVKDANKYLSYQHGGYQASTTDLSNDAAYQIAHQHGGYQYNVK